MTTSVSGTEYKRKDPRENLLNSIYLLGPTPAQRRDFYKSLRVKLPGTEAPKVSTKLENLSTLVNKETLKRLTLQKSKGN